MLALQDVLPQGVDPTKCELALTIVWILGFTMVLCWSILQVPDGGGTAAWVPDVVCRQRILMVITPSPSQANTPNYILPMYHLVTNKSFPK